MNWLAHLLLSEDTANFRLGNILPDMLRLDGINALPEVFARGVACHRAIDTFTDAHPVVKKSVARIRPPFRRYGNALADVFYDHFLSVKWSEYSQHSRDDLIAEFYASFDDWREQIPPQVFPVLQRMREQNWLGSYETLDGVELTLRRMSGRLKSVFPLHEAVGELKNSYSELQRDFEEYFPQLVAHVVERFDVSTQVVASHRVAKTLR
jgi:acyl carrier protein phosphodiesterase